MSLTNREARLERLWSRLTPTERKMVGDFLAAEPGDGPYQRGTLAAWLTVDAREYVNLYLSD